MYRVIAGIDTDGSEDGVGYKKIIIKPQVDGTIIKAGQNSSEWSKMNGLEKNKDSVGGLKNVSASLTTGYGKLSSSWKIENGKLLLDVEIPANTNATIYIPAKEGQVITESGKPVSAIKEKQPGFVMVEVGSGSYHFAVE